MAQVTVKHRFIHQAPRKLRLMGDMVRGLPANKAIAELGTMTQTGSTTVAKVVKAAVAAAKEQGLDANNLFIEKITVDEGPKMRRFIPMSRGRSQRILKRMSHLTISLTDEAVKIASGRAYKAELGQTKTGKAAKTTKPATKPAKAEKTEEALPAQTTEPAEVTTEATEAVETAETTEGSK